MIVFADATPTDLLHYVNSGGVIGLLVFIIVAGWRGWWVSKREYDTVCSRLANAEEQSVKWMELAFKATSISEQVSQIVEK